MTSRPTPGVLRGATPLIDLLFLLLFGMLALSDSRSATTAETVRVNLPRVEREAAIESAGLPAIVIEIDARSRVRVEGATGPIHDPADLDRTLAGLMETMLPEETVIEIRGDSGARHGVAVGLLQHLRRRGFASVHLLALGAEDADWIGDGR